MPTELEQWRRLHGRGRNDARPVMGAETVTLESGARVSCENVSIFVDCASSPDRYRPDEYRPARAVRSFFAQRKNRPDERTRPPCLNFELIQATANRCTIRVFGPRALMLRYFDGSFNWPKWVLSVSFGMTARVVGQSSLPSERFASDDTGAIAPCAVRQSECKRDRFARIPVGANGDKKLRATIQYLRASAEQRRAIAPLTAPREFAPSNV